MPFSLTKLAVTTSEAVLGSLLIALLLAGVVFLFSIPYLDWFRQEMKYINTEIERNQDHPREQARWKRRKKRLLMSLIPGIKYE
ncbi:MAG: hypothetical protein IKA50_00430 [Clostridia bacterium]|nr:hypothetical protein [Clostridia bacterium]